MGSWYFDHFILDIVFRCMLIYYLAEKLAAEVVPLAEEPM